MYLNIVGFPSATPICAKTVLTDCVNAFVSEMGPGLSPLKLCRGTPLMILLSLPSITESGVYRPESSAAAAVTTLKVDPGAYLACVARLRRGDEESPFSCP